MVKKKRGGGHVGSQSVNEWTLIHNEGNSRQFDRCTVRLRKVSNSCQRKEAWGEWQLDLVDPVTAKRQRKTCCQDGHTWVGLHTLLWGLCLIRTGSTATCGSINPRNYCFEFDRLCAKCILVLWCETTTLVPLAHWALVSTEENKATLAKTGANASVRI